MKRCSVKSEGLSGPEAVARAFHAVASEWSCALGSSFDNRCWSVADMDLACPASFSHQVAGGKKLCTLLLFRQLRSGPAGRVTLQIGSPHSLQVKWHACS